MLQGLFLVFSASVIFFNLVADLLYAYLDPRVRTRVSTVEPTVSGRTIAWRRRRRALAQSWREFRGSRPGMIGLVMLAVIVAGALAAPLLADHDALSAANSRRQPGLGASARVPAHGNRQPRREASGRSSSGARGSASSSGFAATIIAIVIGSLVGIVAGFFERLGRRRADAPDRVVPRDPVPPAGDRARRDPRAVGLEHHLRDRDHVVAEHGPRDPRAGALGQGAALRRALHARSAPRTAT